VVLLTASVDDHSVWLLCNAVLFAANPDSAELRAVLSRVNALLLEIILNNIPFFHFNERLVALPMIFARFSKLGLLCHFSQLFFVLLVDFFDLMLCLVSQPHGNSLLCPTVHHPVLFMLNISNGGNLFFSMM